MKPVNQRKGMLDEQFAHHKGIARHFGETAHAGIRPRRAAQAPVSDSHELAVVGADRVIVMQGENDRRLRQGPPHQLHSLDADQQRMMEMNDSGLDRSQQPLQFQHHAMQIDLRHVEAIVMAGPQQQFVGRAAHRLQQCPGQTAAMELVDTGQIESFDAQSL